MKTKSGVLVLNKTDVKEFNELIRHVERDLDWAEGGSFGDGEKRYEKEIKMVKNAVESLKWIIENSK